MRTLISSLGENTGRIECDEEVQQRHLHRPHNGRFREFFGISSAETLGPLHGYFDMTRFEPERPRTIASAAILAVPTDSLGHRWEIRDEPEACDGVNHGDHSIDDLQSARYPAE